MHVKILVKKNDERTKMPLEDRNCDTSDRHDSDGKDRKEDLQETEHEENMPPAPSSWDEIRQCALDC